MKEFIFIFEKQTDIDIHKHTKIHAHILQVLPSCLARQDDGKARRRTIKLEMNEGLEKECFLLRPCGIRIFQDE